MKYEFEYASNYNMKFDETQGRNLGDSFLLLLLIVLIVEQCFAWSCSYHVSTRMTNPWNPAAGRHTVPPLYTSGRAGGHAKGGPA